MGLLTLARRLIGEPSRDIRTLSGPEFERWMARLYERLGCAATVMGGSGDQGVDIILITPDSVKVAVQCKNHARSVGNSCVQQVLAGAVHYGCDEAWVVAPNGFTEGARQLANSVGVKLYDAAGVRGWVEIANRETA